MSAYRNNHYVPVWFQEAFLPPNTKERKFHYLDLHPDQVVVHGHRHARADRLRWGPKSCFCSEDLYTTRHGSWISTEIEEKFFGPVDSSARPSVEYFASFHHPSAHGDHLNTFLRYMSIQKLRTPKGLYYLSALNRDNNRNTALFGLQKLQQIFCANWAECAWAIVSAHESGTKFLLSDHPVTVYNSGVFPESRMCRAYGDPEVWQSGTHTIFPLSLDKLLILTNLSWSRNPYGNPTRPRPNPRPFRQTIFNFTDIQIGRSLTEREVVQINYIIKNRARRYVAAAERDWLFPERQLGKVTWNYFGKSYLLMPDPRSMTFSSGVVVGYEGGGSEAFDAYGRQPGQPGYRDDESSKREWQTFNAFQGEFARLFGPKRRGRAYEMGRMSDEEDSPDYHEHHLRLERIHKKHRYDR